MAPPIATLAELYTRQERWAEAEPLYGRLLEHADETPTVRTQSLVAVLSRLARVYRALGRGSEALPLYERALALQEAERQRLLAAGGEAPARAIRVGTTFLLTELLRPYAEELHAQRRLEDAAAAYRRGQALVEDAIAHEVDHAASTRASARGLMRDLATLLVAYAALLREQGRPDANVVAARAATLQAAATAPPEP